MDHSLKIKNKQILSDPVNAYTSLQSEADNSKKNQLQELWFQLQALKKQGNTILTQTKIISRQIGEAKKNNQPAEQLIQSMQTHSNERKQIEERQKDIEELILGFFVISEEETSDETEEGKTSPVDRYTSATCDIDTITVSLLDSEEDEWNNYVSKQPAATIHHLSQWRRILQNTYGIESYYYFARDNNNRITGILPLVRLKSRLFGDMFVSMPYFQRGGAVANHPLIEKKLIQSANETASRLGIDHIEYRDDVPRDDLPSQDHKVNMVLSLPESEDILWNGFTPKLRAQIKRPQQLSHKVVIGGKEYLDDFYKVYTRNMRDLGSPAHSKFLVENILDHFPENSWILVIRLNNKPVSAGILLGHGDTMEIPLASTIRKVNPHSMNMLLYWEALKLAIRQGYKCFDFGRSSIDTGTYRFKQQWGAQPKQLYWHYWLSNTDTIPSLNPSNPKYALVINIWKRLPLIIVNQLGPLIVKNIP